MRRLPQPLSGLHRGRRTRLWLGLPGTDGRGLDPGADRHRRGRPSAQRIDVLRALRERLSGPDPAAEDDAALARAAILSTPDAGGLPQRREALDVGRAAPGAVPRACRGQGAPAGLAWRRAWPVSRAAAGRRLDAVP